jgi:DNA-binding FadR family transcriptional regulator
MSAVIVQQIRGLIRSGKLQAGDRLPPERQLAAQFGVSRVTVRDALRGLQASGLVEVRVGANGGAVITRPTGARVGERLSDMVLLDALEAAEITEARIVLELAIVDLVCARATPEDLAALEEICGRSEAALAAGTYNVELSSQFHLRYARSTHNRALDLILGSFRGAVHQSLLSARQVAPVMGRRGVREHRALLEALRGRDPVAARAVLAPHLHRTAGRLRAALEGVLLREDDEATP